MIQWCYKPIFISNSSGLSNSWTSIFVFYDTTYGLGITITKNNLVISLIRTSRWRLTCTDINDRTYKNLRISFWASEGILRTPVALLLFCAAAGLKASASQSLKITRSCKLLNKLKHHSPENKRLSSRTYITQFTHCLPLSLFKLQFSLMFCHKYFSK